LLFHDLVKVFIWNQYSNVARVPSDKHERMRGWETRSMHNCRTSATKYSSLYNIAQLYDQSSQVQFHYI